MDGVTSESSEPARKRQKFSPSSSISAPPPQQQIKSQIEDEEEDEETLAMRAKKLTQAAIALQIEKEAKAGILRYVNETNPGFSGILKQRYTDFLVNEITPDGKVMHLVSTSLPKRPGQSQPQVSEVQRAPASTPETVNSPPKTLETTKVPSVDISTVPGVDVSSATEAAKAHPAVKPTFSLSEEDSALLDSYFGSDTKELILKLYQRVVDKPDAKAAAFGSVTSHPITDRQLRTELHKNMRRIFESRLETLTESDGLIKVSAAAKPKRKGDEDRNGGRNNDNKSHNQQTGQLGWSELGGEYLHFSLYKENKDTMEVISFIAGRLKMRPKAFSFAGTKDRRGVTVQRVSVCRMRAEMLVGLNNQLYGSKIGDFKYEKHGLELGELAGNEFVITLRDCNFKGFENLPLEEKLKLATTIVGSAVENIQKHGFLNYYGLQRFGTFSVGTDDIGKMILSRDFEGAVNAILGYSEDALLAYNSPGHLGKDKKPISKDDIARAHACWLFKTTGKSHPALDKLPRKFSAESTLIRHLVGQRKGDYIGGLLQINRNLRLMYVHAYQSKVWNMVVSKRWERFGGKVIKGDLVIVDNETSAKPGNQEEVDENGEVIILPAADDFAISADDIFQRARPLTAEEAESGAYSIFDIVLPTPGFDIEYPDNEIGDFYKEFMLSDTAGGIDPANMRRSQKDFSLSGSYRNILGKVGNDVTFEVKPYTQNNEQLVETDLDRLQKLNVSSQPKGTRDNQLPSQSQGTNSKISRISPGRELAPEDRDAKHNAWKNLPATLAEDDKILTNESKGNSANGITTAELLKTIYNSTFIETQEKDGKRTGHQEKSVSFAQADVPREESQDTVAQAPNIDGVTKDITGIEATKTAASLLKRSESVLSFLTDSSEDGGVSLDPKDWDKPRPDHRVRSLKATPLNNFIKDESEAATTDYHQRRVIIEEDDDTTDVESQATENKKRTVDKMLKSEGLTKIAVVVRFQLGSSQYATMALRELMKQGGVSTYSTEFTNSR